MRDALRNIHAKMTATESKNWIMEGDATIEARDSYGRELAIANRLAQRFGHDWAGRWTEEEIIANPPSLAEIRKACVEQEDRPSWMIGITAPAVSEAWLVHTTATGRTSWEVWADGTGVSIAISRPSGEVLRLEVELDENLEVSSILWREVKPCGVRHVEALREALDAFGAGHYIPESMLEAARSFDAYELSIRALEDAQASAWKDAIVANRI